MYRTFSTQYRRRYAVAVGALVLGASLVAGVGVSAAAGLALSVDGVQPAGVCQQPNPPDWCTTPPPPPPTADVILNVGSQQYDWGNEHQQVSATLYKEIERSNGAIIRTYVTVTTHTWTTNIAWGFHATSYVQLNPSSYATTPQTYGVTGAWLTMPDRTDSYTEDVPVATALADSLTANPAGSIKALSFLD